MKFKIHFVDDDNLNLKPLLVEENAKLNSDAEMIALCDTIFEYEYFSRVDKAINFYELHGETAYPDLIIIDISFDSLENTGHSQAFLFTWGVEMGIYANNTFPNSPRIFLSGQSNNSNVIEQLRKKNIKIDELDLIRKAETNHFKERLSTLLQKRAKYLFGLLNENQRGKLWKKIAKNVDLRKDKDLGEIDFGLRKMILRNLLWGYGDIDLMSSDDVNSLVADILQGLGKDIQFSGEWKNGYVKEMLKNYQDSENDDYEDTKRSFDRKAFNLLLEILQIRTYYIKEDNTDEIELHKNSIKQLCTSCKANDIETQKIFEQKMIGRRAVLGFCALFENGNKTFNLNVLCSLLKRGITYDESNDAPIDAGNVINTGLGLISRGGRVIYNRQTMLFEEEEWYRNIGRYAIGVRDFLDNYSVKSFIGTHDDTFIDIEDVEKVIRTIRTTNIKKYSEFISHMKETIDDHDRHLIPIVEHLLGFQFE